MYIFFADDDDDDFLFFKDAVSEQLTDFIIERVKDGLECLYALKNESSPDIIFIDLNMPLKNGIDCLKAIRELPELDGLPVIIYSTSHNIKDIDAAYKHGATYYLVKPSSIQKLSTLLRKLFLLLKQPKISPVLKTDFVVREEKASYQG